MNIKSPLKKIYLRTWYIDSLSKYKFLSKYISKDSRIIDIGAGPCMISGHLHRHGINTTSLDVVDENISKVVNLELYDGNIIPYPDKSFDFSLLLTVLHHSYNPELLLREAFRVSHNAIIIEDIYDNVFEKYLTWFLDSLFNWQFLSHPHANKTLTEWNLLFTKYNWEVKLIKINNVLFIKQAYIVLTEGTS
jgi:SAM-dependent methyltransferase